jgi:hypothetical protein
MMLNREKVILETLRYAFEVKLPRLSSNKSRIKVWERLKKYLWWDDSEAHLKNLDELNEIQEALRNFFDESFMPILEIYFSSPWKGTPDDELDRIAQNILSEGKAEDYEIALSKAIKANPRLGKIWAKGAWLSKELPAPNPKRFFYCDGEVFRCAEEYESISSGAIQRVIRLFAMSPPLPISKFYKCEFEDCNRWAINNRKSRKHWFCSKRCYDRGEKREKRNPKKIKKKKTR